MKLRLFLAGEGLSGAMPFLLLDGRGHLLREGTATIDEMPRADEAELVLPASRVLFARLALPRVGATTLRELLPFAVEDRLLDDPAQAHAVAGRRDSSGLTTVAIVEREWLAATIDAVRRAGLRPLHAWSESALVASSEGEWNVVWGSQRGMLVDDRGASVAFDRAGAELPLAIRLGLDEAAARGERPARILVHAEGGAALASLDAWSREAGVPFAAGEAWESLRARSPGPQAIDLLQDEFAPTRSRRGVSRIPRAAFALAAVIAVLHVAFVALDAWRLQRERRALEARQEEIFRTAFPEARTIVDPSLQLSRNVAELRRTRGLAAGDDFLQRLTQAGRESHGPVQAIEYANGRLQVQRK